MVASRSISTRSASTAVSISGSSVNAFADAASSSSVIDGLPKQTILVGALDLSTHEVETAETVADRLRNALKYVSPDRVIAAPDCGLKYLPQEIAFGKLKALVEGARIVRAEVS